MKFVSDVPFLLRTDFEGRFVACRDDIEGSWAAMLLGRLTSAAIAFQRDTPAHTTSDVVQGLRRMYTMYVILSLNDVCFKTDKVK